VTAAQQWWRSEPDHQCGADRRRKKGGPWTEEAAQFGWRGCWANWESGDIVSLPRPSRPGIILDGPLLGALPARPSNRCRRLRFVPKSGVKAFLEAQRQEGKNPDPIELAKMRQQHAAMN